MIIKVNREILTQIFKSTKLFTYCFLEIIQIIADIQLLFKKEEEEEKKNSGVDKEKKRKEKTVRSIKLNINQMAIPV